MMKKTTSLTCDCKEEGIMNLSSGPIDIINSDQEFVSNSFELTILMPCLNEALTLSTCIIKAKNYLSYSGINGEILIADNGSTDGSQDIARSLGARVIPVV